MEILTKCLQDVSSWMSSRKLKLNPDKTEFLLIVSKVQRGNFSKSFPTRLLAPEVTPSPSARNLGKVFDSALNFKNHISGISRACYYHIRDMRRIKRFLTPSVAKTIAASLIGSKLDYCNSVLLTVTEKEISKLQGVQNCLARVVKKSPRFCHITPLLKSLHWLPVLYIIKFYCKSCVWRAVSSDLSHHPQSPVPLFIHTLPLGHRWSFFEVDGVETVCVFEAWIPTAGNVHEPIEHNCMQRNCTISHYWAHYSSAFRRRIKLPLHSTDCHSSRGSIT